MKYELTAIQNYTFIAVTVLSYLLYFLLLLGVSTTPRYYDSIRTIVQVYISLFLIWRFNPFRQTQFNYLDKRIAFSAGVFLLSTSIITDIFKASNILGQNHQNNV